MLDPINISIDGSPVLSPSPAGAQPAQALSHRDLVSSPGPPPLPHSPVLSPMPLSENNRFRSPSLVTPASPNIPLEPIPRWLEGTVAFPRSRDHFGHGPRRIGGVLQHNHHEERTNVQWDEAERRYLMLREKYIDKDPEVMDEVPSFGAPDLQLYEHPLSHDKVESVKRVLVVLGKMCEVDFCPLLVDLVALLSNLLPEAAVYTAVYHMYEHRPYYFVTSHKAHLAAMAVFRDLVTQRFPETAAFMALLGADQESFLGKLFYRCFVPLLNYHDAVRVLDLYLADGLCFFYRLGMAIIKDLKWKLKVMELTSAHQWWAQLQDLTMSPDFDLAETLGPLMNRYRKRVRHSQLRAAYSHKLASAELLSHQESLVKREDLLPLAVLPNADGQLPHLVRKRAHLKTLTSFLPTHKRHHSLRMLYSSEVHGRSLATLYRLCRRSTHPVFVVMEETSTGTLVGGFCTSPLDPDDRPSIGSGECFVFRLAPHPVWAFRWNNDVARRALSGDSFQVCTPDFFAMGLGGDSDHPALKLDASLDHGSSHASSVFNNVPLCGRGLERFHVARVEVLQLVPPRTT